MLMHSVSLNWQKLSMNDKSEMKQRDSTLAALAVQGLISSVLLFAVYVCTSYHRLLNRIESAAKIKSFPPFILTFRLYNIFITLRHSFWLVMDRLHVLLANEEPCLDLVRPLAIYRSFHELLNRHISIGIWFK